MHIADEPEPLRKSNPNLPEELEKIVLRTLEKEPEKRPTAKELGQELMLLFGIDPKIGYSSDDDYPFNTNFDSEADTVAFDR
jgi:serine/threonine protein kinase